MTGAAVRALSPMAAVQQAHQAPTDSVAVESPLPGGVAEVTRFLLNTVPPWVQLGGLILGAIIAVIVLVIIVRRREAVQDWYRRRARPLQIALGVVAVLVLAGTVGFGAASWNYTQHDNDFCTGCHVMNPAFQKFGSAENAHAELSCHDCHQQSMYASARQLYLWIKERPEVIGVHAKVPNDVCARCHVTSDTARWQRVAGTAGHRVHLESDSSVLEGVQCVTCHGLEVHQFRPAKETCGQSDCHKPEDTEIVLGTMASQTVRHCTSCHAFTADVPALATRDSARSTLTPGMDQCLGCHEMRRVLHDYDPRRDPHNATCGTCHNPHEQERPAQAVASCTTAGCHGDWRTEPFHVGEAHGKVGEQCLTCHEPHSAQVDASECTACHVRVRERSRMQPPLPFDTAAALRPVGDAGHDDALLDATGIRRGPAGVALHRPRADRVTRHPRSTRVSSRSAPGAVTIVPASYREPAAPSGAAPPDPLTVPAPAPVDTFSHARHARLACLVCHETGTGHGRLTFAPPRGCAICHHQAPARAQCASCHREREYGKQAATVTVTVGDREPNAHAVDFMHSVHKTPTCVTCHATPVTLAPPPEKALCRDCHTDHHDAGRACASCHTIAEPKAAHTTLEVAHQRCDACHTAQTVARLTPTRTFCATCHTAKSTNHYEPRECTVCHFLAEPGAYRTRLSTPPPS